MFGFLKAIFLDDKARAALDKAKAKPVAAKAKPPSKLPAKPATGSERQKLLKEAMAVHRAKRKILDHLSDEDRAKLVSMAILAFLNEGREPDNNKK